METMKEQEMLRRLIKAVNNKGVMVNDEQDVGKGSDDQGCYM